MENCPNCGSTRPDRFCSRCGQNNRDYMRGLWSVVYEFLSESFEFDSRLLRTLKALLFKPGRLSAEFSRNRRAAYMSPVRLYLVVSFVFFLILSITARGSLSNLTLSDDDALASLELEGAGDGDATEASEFEEPAGSDPDSDAEDAEADSALAVADSVLTMLDSVLAERGISLGTLTGGALADSVLAARVRAGGERVLSDAETADTAVAAAADPADPETVSAAVAGMADAAVADTEDAPVVETVGAAVAETEDAAVADTADPGAVDEPESRAVPPERLEAFKAGLSPLQRLKVDDILSRSDGLISKQAIETLVSLEMDGEKPGWGAWLAGYTTGLVIDLFHDPDEFLQQAIGNLPIAMFFLLPVFALILALCYTGKGRFFVEHLVFGMHVHTFAFLVLAAALLVPGETDGNWVKLVLIAVTPIYLLIALRRFYGDGWRWSLVKGFVVWNLYTFVLIPGLLLAFLVRT